MGGFMPRAKVLNGSYADERLGGSDIALDGEQDVDETERTNCYPNCSSSDYNTPEALLSNLGVIGLGLSTFTLAKRKRK